MKQTLITDYFYYKIPICSRLETLPDICLNRIATFLTEPEVDHVIFVHHHNDHIRRCLEESKMRLTIYCYEYDQFEKNIRYSISPRIWYPTCASFANIHLMIEQEFQDDCRYRAEIYKMIDGVRKVVYTEKNPKAVEWTEYSSDDDSNSEFD